MPHSGSPAPLRILLIDECGATRRRVRRLLEEAGGTEIAGETETASEALELCRQVRPEAVVMDMKLRDGPGCGLLRQIARLDAGCVIVVLTGFVTPHFRTLCLELGAAVFLDKAAEFDRLPAALASAISARDRKSA